MSEKPRIERNNRAEQPSFEIREITAETIQTLADIRRAVDGEKNIQPPEKFARELARYEAGGEHKAFLMEVGGKVVGYVEVDLKEDYIPAGADREKCQELKDYAHIARVGLVAESRGKGLGNELLAHAEGWARASGAPGIWLDFLPEKEALVTFYEAAGYETFVEFRDGNKDRLRRISLKRL